MKKCPVCMKMCWDVDLEFHMKHQHPKGAPVASSNEDEDIIPEMITMVGILSDAVDHPPETNGDTDDFSGGGGEFGGGGASEDI